MRMKYLLTGLFFSVVLLLTIATSTAEEIPKFKIMTEPWIPYQFEKDGNIQGIAVDLLVLMLEKVGSTQGREDIKMYPWARGFLFAQNEDNTILFSTTRTQDREKMFKWVGPIFTNAMCLIARKDSNFKINTLKDIKNYKIGTVIDDVSEQLLIQEGFTLDMLQRNTLGISNIRKLKIGRIDMVIQSFPGFLEGIVFLGLNPNDYECVFKLSSYEISYAFHKATSDSIIEKFQNALNDIKAEGKLMKIYQSYNLLYVE